MNKLNLIGIMLFGAVGIVSSIASVIESNKRIKETEEMAEMAEKLGKRLNDSIKESSMKLEEDTKNLMQRLRYRVVIAKKFGKEIIIDEHEFKDFGEALDYELELYKTKYNPNEYYIHVKLTFVVEED